MPLGYAQLQNPEPEPEPEATVTEVTQAEESDGAAADPEDTEGKD